MTVRPADNPFASRRIDALGYRFDHGDIDDVLAALARSGGRGAIVGPHGSGKTTLLDALARRLDAEMIRLRLDAATPDRKAAVQEALPDLVDRRDAVLVDGAEQLGPLGWWRLHRRARAAGVLVITSHEPGRLPTIHRCTTSSALLADLVRTLSPETAEPVDLDALFHRHRGNLRLCLRELYDLHAGRRDRTVTTTKTPRHKEQG